MCVRMCGCVMCDVMGCGGSCVCEGVWVGQLGRGVLWDDPCDPSSISLGGLKLSGQLATATGTGLVRAQEEDTWKMYRCSCP